MRYGGRPQGYRVLVRVRDIRRGVARESARQSDSQDMYLPTVFDRLPKIYKRLYLKAVFNPTTLIQSLI
jgi:hypothetical protein